MKKYQSSFWVSNVGVAIVCVALLLLFFASVIAVSAWNPADWLLIPFAIAWTVLALWLLMRYIRAKGVAPIIRRHLGINHAHDGDSSMHTIPERNRVDLQKALELLHEQDEHQMPVIGVGAAQPDASYGSAAYSVSQLLITNPRPSELQWETVIVSSHRRHTCVRNALFMLLVNDTPFCALVLSQDKIYRQPAKLEIFAPDEVTADAAWQMIERKMAELSIFKHQSISLQTSENYEERFDVKLHPIPAVPLEQIILPAALLRVIERNTLFFLTQQESLRKAGQRTQRGLLFHGPPGTGKTLVTKYIASMCKATVIVLSGANMAFIREACEYGKRLAPAIIVLEDVDLVAPDRTDVVGNTTLHSLMEAMDGLGPQSDCLFILTTNRPESLEKALASRPGRVDQTFIFPLPEREERRRLFARFSADVDLTGVNIEPLLDRTDGSSPAFIQELVRKAVMIALERGEKSSPLRIGDDDFREAMNEIVLFGGELTRRILGFMPSPTDLPLR